MPCATPVHRWLWRPAAVAVAAVAVSGCLAQPLAGGGAAGAGQAQHAEALADDVDRVESALDDLAGARVPPPAGCPQDRDRFDALVDELGGDRTGARRQLGTAQQLAFDELATAAERC